MKTAESIISDEINRVIFPWIDEKPEQMEAIKHVTIEVAKFYVEAALKAASEKAKLSVIPYDQEEWEVVPNPLKASDLRDEDEMEDGEIEVNKESILSAYPEINIK